MQDICRVDVLQSSKQLVDEILQQGKLTVKLPDSPYSMLCSDVENREEKTDDTTL